MPRKPKKDEFRYTVPAVEKAFAILELFVSENRDYSMSEVSRRLKLPISTTSSLLQTLHRCGYMARNSKRQYSLTMKLLTEGNKLLNHIEVRSIAHAEAKKLSAATGLTSFIALPDGDQLVYVDKVDGGGELKLSAQIGRRMHFHSSATGKALLSNLPEEQVDAIARSTGLPASTGKTITSLLALKRELARVRAQGYSFDDEESSPGIRGIAAPIFNHEGRVAASVGVAAPSFELSGHLEEAVESVKRCAESISLKMGYHPAEAAVSAAS